MRWSDIVVAAAALGVGAYLVRSVWFPPATVPAAELRAQGADEPPQIFAAGVVEGAQPERSLRFEIAGRLKAVHVREGDRVRAGEVLAELETPPLQLRAPIDGLVVAALPQPGELVGPADDRDVVTLVDRSRTRVRAYVEERDAMRVAVGQPAVVIAAGAPDRPAEGVVASCAPGVRPKTFRHQQPGEWLDVRVREVVIDLDDGADLLLGLPVEVFIAPSQPAEAAAARAIETVNGTGRPLP